MSAPALVGSQGKNVLSTGVIPRTAVAMASVTPSKANVSALMVSEGMVVKGSPARTAAVVLESVTSSQESANVNRVSLVWIAPNESVLKNVSHRMGNAMSSPQCAYVMRVGKVLIVRKLCYPVTGNALKIPLATQKQSNVFAMKAGQAGTVKPNVVLMTAVVMVRVM